MMTRALLLIILMKPMDTKKTQLYLPLEFWSEILVVLDKKMEQLTKDYGFGQVGLTIISHNGKVTDVIFEDQIRVRGLVDKAKNGMTLDK